MTSVRFARTRNPRRHVIEAGSLCLVVLMLISAPLVSCDPQSTGSSAGTTRRAASPEKPAPSALLLDARNFVAEGKLGYAKDRIALLKRLHPESPEASEADALLREVESKLSERVSKRRKEQAKARILELENKWSYSVRTDPMTSRKSRAASIQSENWVNFDFPYRGAQRATLTLRAHPSYGTDVIVSIEQGQILCSSYKTCDIRVRFDDGTAQSWQGIGPEDNSSTSVFIRNYSRFLTLLRRSNEVRVQLPVYQEGAPIFEFHVAGFDSDRYGNQ